jgi:hypothetical protein
MLERQINSVEIAAGWHYSGTRKPAGWLKTWRSLGESNPSFQIENLAS